MALMDRAPQRWLAGGVLVALTLVAMLPPRPASDGPAGRWRGRVALSQEEIAGQTVDRLRAAILRGERDAEALRLSRTAAAVKSLRYPVAVVSSGGIERDSLVSWLRALEREVGTISGLTSAAGRPVVVRLARTEPEARLVRGGRLHGRSPDSLSCVVELDPRFNRWNVQLSRDRTGQVQSEVLHACALVAAFGAPGSAWTRDAVGERRSWRGSTLAGAVRASRERQAPEQVDWRRVQGDFYYGSADPLLAACARGEAAVCRALVGIDVPENGRWPARRSYWFGMVLERTEFFAYLLEHGTPEQFRALWTSTKPPAEAIAEAYGRPADDVLREWMQHRLVVVGGGPWPSGRVVIGSLMWIPLLIGIGAAAATLRRGMR